MLRANLYVKLVKNSAKAYNLTICFTYARIVSAYQFNL